MPTFSVKTLLAFRATGFFLFLLFTCFQNSFGFISFGTLTSGNQTLCLPADPGIITFLLAPSGASPFTYNWFYKDGLVAAPTGSNPGDWTIIYGATSSSYNPPAGLESARTYACFVSGPNAIRNWATGARQVNVYSNGKIKNLYQPFLLTGDPLPTGFDKLPNGPAGMTFGYQWYYKNGIVPEPTGTTTTGWTLIAGATGTAYNPPAGPPVHRTYACFVTHSNSTSCPNNRWAKGVQHAMVYPFINGTISIGQDRICSPADPGLFSFTTLLTPGTTRQWYYQDGLAVSANGLDMEASVAGWTLIPGATSLSYDPPAGLTTNRAYACRVSNGQYSLWSNALQIYVTSTTKGVISNQQTGCAGFNPAPITFATVPIGSADYYLNWYYVEDPNIACPTTANFAPLNWIALNTIGPILAGSMSSEYHDPITSGSNGRTYILQLSPAYTPSCETPYVTNCHRIFVNPCRESFDEAEGNENPSAFLGDVFPNPGSGTGEVEYHLPAGQSHGQFTVRTLDGKLVFQQEITSGNSRIQLDRTRFHSGMYFYTLEADGMSPVVKKMVVQK